MKALQIKSMCINGLFAGTVVNLCDVDNLNYSIDRIESNWIEYGLYSSDSSFNLVSNEICTFTSLKWN